ncbi:MULTISPECIES: type IV secretory system conjugative DNA transfer family protein [Mesorhizobium]|uniref:type IV secretory system conjugative DNA transfer family protein n=1 Tax=Mesorhizobium TaxID=68287 RepID=UPI000BAFAD25|nr:MULTISPECIES: type IV secretory system conjugative DNA transfer family protein [Mesorhizobium]PBB29720.1 hypothetical protein CK214_23375 [Mesorhizobium sp. WSM3882]PBB39647.1 hypothetical protein CK221_02185 [Mesorhizobium sp. WSM3868]PBB40578.1 hypothetical protein CK222_27420 [Mesorhizobium sp. WSM3866]PBB59140.1 hypothetical protein CK217_26335 [Mesorhizobium loti]PBB80175.1 hypothetical protein CK218_16275 [Mesorhizobium sp. WSM3879]
MFVVHSLAALTGLYEQSGRETFLCNTGIEVFMATADEETPIYLPRKSATRLLVPQIDLIQAKPNVRDQSSYRIREPT